MKVKIKVKIKVWLRWGNDIGEGNGTSEGKDKG